MTEGNVGDFTLEDVLIAAAEETADTIREDDSWLANGQPFAALQADGATFRLDPLVARAALRTPDTAPSPRGPEWVSFAPTVLDDPAIDRAEAWFLSAHRRVTEARRGNR